MRYLEIANGKLSRDSLICLGTILTNVLKFARISSTIDRCLWWSLREGMGVCPHFLGGGGVSSLYGGVSSLPGVSLHFLRCPHFLGCALTSWGVPSLPGCVSSLPGVCPHFLGCVLTSWGVSSLPGVCPHFLGGLVSLRFSILHSSVWIFPAVQ